MGPQGTQPELTPFFAPITAEHSVVALLKWSSALLRLFLLVYVTYQLARLIFHCLFVWNFLSKILFKKTSEFL